MRRTLAIIVLLAATAFSAGCRRANDANSTGDVLQRERSVVTPGASVVSAQLAPTLPPCAQAGLPVTPAPEFPRNFPLPPGTVITVSRRAEPALVVQGFIPMELREATRFFVQNLPMAGFLLGRGDAERGEAEARFGGNGVVGFFKLRIIENCPRALEFTIRVQSAIVQPE